MNIELRHVITQIIAFLLMYWIMKRYAWSRLYTIIEGRRKRIESEFANIENGKKEIQKLNDQYQKKLADIEAEGQTKIQEAIAEGRKAAEEIQKATQKESNAILTKAREDIGREVEKAKAGLKKEVVNLAIAASKKLIRNDLDTDKQKKMIEDLVEEVDLK